MTIWKSSGRAEMFAGEEGGAGAGGWVGGD